jgi:hypothetical protein
METFQNHFLKFFSFFILSLDYISSTAKKKKQKKAGPNKHSIVYV